MNKQLTPETMTLKKQIKKIHEEFLTTIPYRWHFKHCGEVIDATVFIKPSIKLTIIGCVDDEGIDLMAGFIDPLTKKEILDAFKLEHERRDTLTQQLIDSLNK